MRVLISGSTGMVGTALVAALHAKGHQPVRLVRKPPVQDSEIFWNPARGELDPMKIEAIDAVVHLSGENIAGSRWTEGVKQKIRESRVKSTRLLVNTLVSLKSPPKVFVCASAIGYYGNRGDETLKEESLPGTGFLADVCKEWEASTFPAIQKGIRTVNLRTSIVLSSKGGALKKMLPPFLIGVGGPIGDGKQYWSWISLEDEVGAILHVIENNSVKGPINLASPQPVTNREFTKILGKVLHRPTIFPMPAFVAKLALGEMADALLLASTRAEPAKLIASGYQFHHRDLESALKEILKK